MSQAPATPKRRRAALRLRAALAGSSGLLESPTLAPSERAALALRVARPAAPPGPEGEVTFLVPLVGRNQVGDFDAVADRLRRTCESFLAQSDPHWRALICGQDDPGLPTDDRLGFLPFTEAITGNDKWDKLTALCRALPERAPGRGYAMPFDADDLLHPQAVAEMRRRQAPGGYLVETGYIRNVATGEIGRAGPRRPAAPLRKPFWKLCGSCAAFAYDLRDGDGRDVAFLAATTRHEHRMFPHLAALAGRPLAPLSRPSVLYELNHGENFGARRGRVGFKTRFVTRHAIGAAEARQVATEFGLDTATDPQA